MLFPISPLLRTKKWILALKTPAFGIYIPIDQDVNVARPRIQSGAENITLRYGTYYLMPKHLHLIAVPEAKDDLNPAMGESHVTGEDNFPGKAQPPQGDSINHGNVFIFWIEISSVKNQVRQNGDKYDVPGIPVLYLLIE